MGSSCHSSLQSTQQELVTCKLKQREPVTSSVTYFKHFMKRFTDFMTPIKEDDRYYGAQLMLTRKAYDQLRMLLNDEEKSNGKDILDLISDAFQVILQIK